jgi:prevent-host-death family protein
MEIGAFDAKNKLGQLLDRVEQGEEVTITRHGRAVARLVPAQRVTSRSDAQAAVERMRRRAEELGSPFDWEEWKAWRDEGRP